MCPGFEMKRPNPAEEVRIPFEKHWGRCSAALVWGGGEGGREAKGGSGRSSSGGRIEGVSKSNSVQSVHRSSDSSRRMEGVYSSVEGVNSGRSS